LIIDRYLIREIIKPLVVICTVLVIIFASYSAARFLADAVSGLLSGATVISLVLLKVVIALEVLLPTTLYLSVVIALGRLYTDSEITALHASGVGLTRVLKAVFRLSLVVAAIVASLSLYVRPWAYQASYRLKAQARAELDISRWEADNFYEIERGDRIIYADEIDHQRNRAEGVFIQRERGDRVQVIYAKEAYQTVDEKTGKEIMVILDGYLYEFPRHGDRGYMMKFEQSALPLRPEEIEPIGYKRKAAATMALARSDKSKDIAELQWRLSTPLSTILLALLGVPLSRASPRQGKYAKVVAAVLVYAVYYNISAMAKTWVEQGVVGSIPGIWWVQIILAGLLLALLFQPTLAFRSRRNWRKSSV
jgi:lipopolysaccharide export system permease protein